MAPVELNEMLEGRSRVLDMDVDLSKIDYDVDVPVIATGSTGRMYYQGFPTGNHYGAAADGLVRAYREGAKLLPDYTRKFN